MLTTKLHAIDQNELHKIWLMYDIWSILDMFCFLKLTVPGKSGDRKPSI